MIAHYAFFFFFASFYGLWWFLFRMYLVSYLVYLRILIRKRSQQCFYVAESNIRLITSWICNSCGYLAKIQLAISMFNRRKRVIMIQMVRIYVSTPFTIIAIILKYQKTPQNIFYEKNSNSNWFDVYLNCQIISFNFSLFKLNHVINKHFVYLCSDDFGANLLMIFSYFNSTTLTNRILTSNIYK